MSAGIGERIDGFGAIGSYAALGDGRTIALFASDGQVGWWPLPRLDSPPAFAAIRDPEHGGHMALSPSDAFTVQRRYLPDTNVLETAFTTAGGTVRATDALCVGHSGLLPWSELVRRIDGVTGTVPMRWRVAPGTGFDSARPWTEVNPATCWRTS